jgi:hypothetical protein
MIVFTSSYAYGPLLFGRTEDLAADLPQDFFVADVQSSTRALMTAARTAFPSSRIALHTASAGLSSRMQTRACMHDEDSTDVEDNQMRIWSGRKTYVTQLNAALRHVAASEAVALVDVEMMASGLTPSQFTANDLHPRSFFTLEVLNVYLNMLAEARRSGGG